MHAYPMTVTPGQSVYVCAHHTWCAHETIAARIPVCCFSSLALKSPTFSWHKLNAGQSRGSQIEPRTVIVFPPSNALGGQFQWITFVGLKKHYILNGLKKEKRKKMLVVTGSYAFHFESPVNATCSKPPELCQQFISKTDSNISC